MNLREVMQKYRQLAGDFGSPVALQDFGLPRAEMEKTFSAFDEDYQISRFLHFENCAGESFLINSFPQTHVAIDAEIQSLL